MKKYSPYILLVLGLFLAGATFFGDQSYEKLKLMQSDLLNEKQDHAELSQEVKDLKQLVFDLNHNPAVIERYARDKFGLAKPEEQVIFFRSSGQSEIK